MQQPTELGETPNDSFNIDTIVQILEKTVLHPKGAWGLALTAILSNNNEPTPLVVAAVAYAVIVSLVRLFIWINSRISSYPPRKLDTSKDVVLVTGGSRGLGLLIAALFSERGFKVATFDISPAPISLANGFHAHVDVRDEKAVKTAVDKVAKVLGPPTILVNAAGIVRGGTVEQMDSDEIRAIFDTNLMGSLWVTRAVLPYMHEASRGHIVNLSSSTQYVGPAKAGIYAASKAAIGLLSETLRQELKGTGIKVLIAYLGQVDTPMFKSIVTPSKFVAPIISGAAISNKIVQYIENGWTGELRSPFYVHLFPWFLVLVPRSIKDLLRAIGGLDKAMDTFTPE